jgi:hypothetical protein
LVDATQQAGAGAGAQAPFVKLKLFDSYMIEGFQPFNISIVMNVLLFAAYC